jgi:hypothetical protein
VATLTQNAVARPIHPIFGRNGLVDRYFYFSMSLLAAAVVLWGFSKTVDANLLHAVPSPPLILYFHAAAFSGWIVFYILQSALVRTHNVRWHRTLGWFGAGLGSAMVMLGCATAVIMARFNTYRLHRPGQDAFLILPLMDMLSFGTCFGLAILWRRKPELHRRLIFIATCVLLDAAFGRVGSLFERNLFYVCVDGVILLGVARDLLVSRRIHKVYLVALPLLMVTQYFVIQTWRGAPSWWLNIAHRIMA